MAIEAPILRAGRADAAPIAGRLRGGGLFLRTGPFVVKLCSDQLAVIDVADGSILPLCRPLSLKNRSIATIRDLAPDAVFAPTIADTRKGTLALLRAPPDSVHRMGERATARYILFPRFVE